MLRPESLLPAGSMVFASAAHAAGFLARTQGNVLLATGAKELSAFAVLEPERLFPRVLPTREGIAACEGADIPHKNIIAMQGPFSYALNRALMEQFAIRFLVTKDGGAAGKKKPGQRRTPGLSSSSSAARPSRAKRRNRS